MDPNIVAEVTKYDPTALYYTYSTIAQTLAAAFAFVGAFVLFRLQNISQNCERISDNVLTLSSGHPSKKQLLAGGWGSFRSNFEEYEINVRVGYKTSSRDSTTEDQKKQLFKEAQKKLTESYTKDYSPIEIENLWQKRCGIIKRFKFLTILNAFTIIASLALLSLSVILCNSKILFLGPLTILVMLSIFCVVECVIIILKTFSSYD